MVVNIAAVASGVVFCGLRSELVLVMGHFASVECRAVPAAFGDIGTAAGSLVGMDREEPEVGHSEGDAFFFRSERLFPFSSMLMRSVVVAGVKLSASATL